MMIARLAASVFLLAAALCGPRAAAQEIRIERVGFSAPVGGAAAAASLGAASISGAVFSLLASPVPLAAPFAPGVSGALGAPAALAAPLLPAAAAVGRSVPAAGGSAPAAAPAPVPAASQNAGPHDRAAAQKIFQTGAAVYAPAAVASRALELDRDAASREFSALLGEHLAEGRDVPVPGSAIESGTPSVAASSRLEAPSRVRIFAAVPVAMAAALPAFHASVATWRVLSVGGYVAGNVGAAIFPLVQIYQALQGRSTPKSRAIIGAAASLALGLICAPILHKTLWGLQNLFGGVTLLVPLLLGALKGTVHGGGLKATLVISAGALAVSGAVYFTAAAAVPALLGALFSAAAISKIALGVQFSTSAMFLWMFLPDVVKVLRGKAAGGFSPGFNLMFFLSAVGSMVWAVPSAWIYSGADRDTYRLIFAVNGIYALASFISYWFARRETKPS